MRILSTVIIILITTVAIAKNLDEANGMAYSKDVRNALFTVELDPNETHCLAQNIYFEAGNQSLEGMAAVADVTINRVESSRYPNTICDVVKQGLKHPSGNMKRNKCQFSWYCDGKSDDIPVDSLHMGINEAWKNSQHIASSMLIEYNLSKTNWLGITEGSTHYHAHYVVPNWINDNGMKRIRQIGSHIFYKFW